jgi:hypothetical protein
LRIGKSPLLRGPIMTKEVKIMKNAGKTVIIVNGDNNTVNIGEPKSRRPVVLTIIICVVIVASALIVSLCCPELLDEFVRWIIRIAIGG